MTRGKGARGCGCGGVRVVGVGSRSLPLSAGFSNRNKSFKNQHTRRAGVRRSKGAPSIIGRNLFVHPPPPRIPPVLSLPPSLFPSLSVSAASSFEDYAHFTVAATEKHGWYIYFVSPTLSAVLDEEREG